MAASRARTPVLWRLFGLAAFAASATAVHAAGFVSASHVESGAVYAEITIGFRCNIQYLGHDPVGGGDTLRVHFESTSVCMGAAPSIADTREQHRPLGADRAQLVSIEYDGQVAGDRQLKLNFERDVRYDVRPGPDGNSLLVRVFAATRQAAERAEEQPEATTRTSRRVERPVAPPPRYVINLESRQRPPATADMPALALPEDAELFVTEAMIGGQRWYRIRVGYFGSAEAASRELRRYREQYPGAWIDRADAVDEVRQIAPTEAAAGTAGPSAETPLAGAAAPPSPEPAGSSATPSAETPDEIAGLMQEGRRSMTAGELSRAVQIYTKVLQLPPNAYQPEAQEFLALARERNGQIAHAKAEYQRFLEVYPDHEGAERVRQRLAALLAGAARPADDGRSASRATAGRAAASRWKIRTFLSQYYRRDVNQLNDEEQIVSQSSIYTDTSIDARHRGERFDFTARLTAGYRSNLMPEDNTQGKDFRLSYAYADLADAQTGLRGRIGRQTRNTGGVLGRFDGLNLTYALNERTRIEAVTGIPVYSTARDVDDSRRFYGLSSAFSPFSENLELGVFLLNQEIEGLTDRQATGAELRYSGEKASLWGLVDYDAEFAELGSMFLQSSLRLPGRLTVSGLVDRRRSPFLSLGNALVGQQKQDFAVLMTLFTEEEIRGFALDRSAATTTYTLGLSRPLSPKLQLNVNASTSSVEATPESAGVAATPSTEYSYYSADFVASGLFRQGDVGILGLRYAVSDSTDVYTVNLDSRFPLGRALRVSPRLRLDYREIRADGSTQWIITPGLRLQYRWGRRMRLELEAGKQFSQRDMTDLADEDRESYFINVGYQYFY